MRSYRFAFVIMLILTFPLFDAAYKFFLSSSDISITYEYAQEESEKKKSESKKMLEGDESIALFNIHYIYHLLTTLIPTYKRTIYDYSYHIQLLKPPIS